MHRMRVIAKSMLRSFWEKHPDAESALKGWHEEAERATWKNPSDIKATYATASFLSSNRVVFNIRGNHYRLVVHVRYDIGRAYIRFVGTHPEYDRINALTI